MGNFENEKKLRKPKKFKEKETVGDIFRKKIKETEPGKRSSKPKAPEVDKSLENLKEDFRFPKKGRRMPEGPRKGKAENPPKRKPGEEKIMTPLAKGGRAMYRSGSKGCKLAMKGKGRAYGKNS